MPRPSDLTTPLVIQAARTAGRDALNRPTVVWETVCATRGAVEWSYRPAEARQAASSQVIVEVGVWVTLRWREGLRRGMRASFGGLTWEIVTVAPDRPRRALRLFCRSLTV